VTGVWSSDFLGVWHLGEATPSANIADSSGNYYTASSVGGMDAGDQVTGKVGYSLDFDGSDDAAFIPDFDPADQGAVSFWVKRTRIDRHERLVGSEDGFEVKYATGNYIQHELFNPGGGSLDSNGEVTDTTTWHHIVATYDYTTSATQIFLDGKLDVSGSTADTDPGIDDLSIGRRTGAGNKFKGTIDEVHISTSVQSSAWYETEYNNQSDPDSFYTLGATSSSLGVTDLTWDYRNRLTEAQTDIATSTYAYDPFDQRMSSVVQADTSVTTHYPTKYYNITGDTPTKHIFALVV